MSPRRTSPRTLPAAPPRVASTRRSAPATEGKRQPPAETFSAGSAPRPAAPPRFEDQVAVVMRAWRSTPIPQIPGRLLLESTRPMKPEVMSRMEVELRNSEVRLTCGAMLVTSPLPANPSAADLREALGKALARMRELNSPPEFASHVLREADRIGEALGRLFPQLAVEPLSRDEERGASFELVDSGGEPKFVAVVGVAKLWPTGELKDQARLENLDTGESYFHDFPSGQPFSLEKIVDALAALKQRHEGA